jgi:hypothetical protein
MYLWRRAEPVPPLHSSRLRLQLPLRSLPGSSPSASTQSRSRTTATGIGEDGLVMRTEQLTSPSRAWPRAAAARRPPGRAANFLARVGARCGSASFHACFCARTPRLRPGHLRRWEQGSRRAAVGENSRPSSSERVAAVTSLGGRCVQCKNTILLNFIELLLEFLQDCSHIVVQIRSGAIFSLQRQISCCCLGGKPTTEF